MKCLELKIHPPIVFISVVGLMWGVSQVLPGFIWPKTVQYAGALICLFLAVSIAVLAVLAFRKAHTTINPHRPETSSSLVTGGVFSFSRNPMYLGLAVLLLGWSWFLMNAYAMLLVIAFIGYITAFQIKPEERMLSHLFGDDYRQYQQRVRRWF
ncbi:MAG: methyltransferase family protein [Arenicella sp.]